MRILRTLFAVAVLLTADFCALWAQESSKDSLFRLVQADQASQITEDGNNLRIVEGNARFFHNNTYLLCDSASWNVDAKMIFAYGNVQILQDQTMLRSGELIYSIDENTARFRGGVVELIDKDGNNLRTEMLDYNTKDSVAVFFGGGAMRNDKGDVIESDKGTYDSKIKTFSFEDEVELAMDSTLIRTTRLDYKTTNKIAYFRERTNVWRDSSFVRADDGWYDRDGGQIHFSKDVYMNDPKYEAWAQDVHYDKNTGEVNMFDNAQILDTLHKAYYTGNHIRYVKESLDGRATLSRNPAVIYCGKNDKHQPDTLYVGADSLFVFSKYFCDIPKEEVEDARQRVEDMLYDPLQKRREEQAVQRAKAEEEAKRKVGKLPPIGSPDRQKAAPPPMAKVNKGKEPPVENEPEPAENETPEETPKAAADSTVAAADSLQVPAFEDSTKIRHILAYHHMKAYRSDIQAACDSMIFFEVDSVARLFGRPILWNQIKNQLTSETMQVLLKDGDLHRGSMLTDAWIISKVDTLHYNQIKSTEMVGYFYDNDLYRYDALGGVNALFYMQDGDKVTTANIKESRSLSAMIRDGNARRMLYMDEIKSDAIPAVDLTSEKMFLKGFEWRGSERPVSRFDITTLEPHKTARREFENLERPVFPQTTRFFNDFKLQF